MVNNKKGVKYIMDENKINRNAEGYIDNTAGEAIKNMDKDSARFFKLLHTIFYLCELAGFQLQGRITLKDKETGRIWK